MFKFYIVVPIALLFLIWRCRRIFAGFVISSALTGLISAWLVGIHGLWEYGKRLLGMSVRLTSNAAMLRYATIQMGMINLRGSAATALGGVLGDTGIQVVVFASSIIILCIAANRRPSFPLPITASALASYDFQAHVASPLIIPLSTALCGGAVWAAAVATLLSLLPTITTVHGAIPVAFVLLVFFLFQAHAKSDFAEGTLQTGEMAL